MSSTRQQRDPPLLKRVLRDDRVATARDLHGEELIIQFATDSEREIQHLVDAIDAGGYQVSLDDDRQQAVVTGGDA